MRGVSVSDRPLEEGVAGLESYVFRELPVVLDGHNVQVDLPGARVLDRHALFDRYSGAETMVFYRISHLVPATADDDGEYTAWIKGRSPWFAGSGGPEAGWSIEKSVDGLHLRIEDWWRLELEGGSRLVEIQSRVVKPNGAVLLNGAPEGPGNRIRQMGGISRLPDALGGQTGPVGPLRFLSILADKATVVQLARTAAFISSSGDQVTVYYEQATPGSTFMRPGLLFPLEQLPGEPAVSILLKRLNFISLMLALFFGTSALPHILIRYYTVPSADAARKSTIVAISGIGLFYILTMYLGVGALAAGAVNPQTNNMSAPLLARSFGEVLFAVTSGIAFTTVLATVSGLIMAASGAVAHDLMGNLLRREVSDPTKVRAGRVVAIVVGFLGIVLGVAFRGMNVSFMVGWAFAVAASANLPSLLFTLFWKKTTAPGIIAPLLALFCSVLTCGPAMDSIRPMHPCR
jgi:cation/acetate symporter